MCIYEAACTVSNCLFGGLLGPRLSRRQGASAPSQSEPVKDFQEGARLICVILFPLGKQALLE